jgi:hypothetical protein
MTYNTPALPAEGNLSLSQAKRDQIALDICREIDASESAKGSLAKRWRVNEDIYHVAPGVTNLNVIEGMEAYNIPLWRPKADRIKGSLVQSLTGVYPNVQVISEGAQDENIADLERTLMSIADYARFNESLDKNIIDALNTNIGVSRVRPVKKHNGMCVQIDWVHPVNMMCYPSHFGSFEEAKTIGHRFWKLLYQVQRQMKDKEYFNEPDLVGGDDPKAAQGFGESGLDRTGTDENLKQEEQYLELWEIITEIQMEEGGEYRKYLCVVAYRQRKLLSIQEYDYPKPWYVDWRTSKEGGRIWPNDSVAQTVQGPQKAYSDIHTVMIQGSMQAAFPPVVMSGGTLMGKAKQYGPAQVWETTEQVQVQVIPITFNPAALAGEADKLEEIVDSLTGINRIGTGEALPATTTATAIDALMTSMAEAKDNYTAALAPSVEMTFGLIYMFLVEHFQEFKEFFGDKVVAESVEEIVLPLRIEATGRSGASSPSTLLQKMQVAREIAANPNGEFDLAKIEGQLMGLLDFPFSTKGMKKDLTTFVREIATELSAAGFPDEEIIQAIQMAGQALVVKAQQEAVIEQQVAEAGAGGGVFPGSDVGADIPQLGAA